MSLLQTVLQDSILRLMLMRGTDTLPQSFPYMVFHT